MRGSVRGSPQLSSQHNFSRYETSHKEALREPRMHNYTACSCWVKAFPHSTRGRPWKPTFPSATILLIPTYCTSSSSGEETWICQKCHSERQRRIQRVGYSAPSPLPVILSGSEESRCPAHEILRCRSEWQTITLSSSHRLLARVRLQNEYVGINDNRSRPYAILGLKGPSIFSTHKQDFTSTGWFYSDAPCDASFSIQCTCPQIGSQNEFFNRCAWMCRQVHLGQEDHSGERRHSHKYIK